MRKMIELTAIHLRNEQPLNPVVSQTELDDLERPVVVERSDEAPALPTHPVMIAVDDVREYYPRQKPGYAPGTRIVFANGSATIVTELYDEVKAKFASVNN